jgi:hypothetical protein
MESQLRDLLHAAVGDPPHRVTVEAVRRRVVRRRRAEWATGTAAVVLLTGLGIVVPGRLFAPGAPTGPNSAPAGAPRYYVQTVITGPKPPPVTVVRSRATGAVTATVRCPWPKSQVAGSGLAAADGQVFFLACQRSHLVHRHFVITGTRVFRFQVTASGRVRGYSAVPGGKLPGLGVGRMAATPDGSQLAMTAAAGFGPGGNVLVLNTRTGARAVWHNGTGAAGSTQFGLGDLSWARHNSELVVQATVRKCPGGTAGQCVPGMQWRALRPPAAGGQLGSSRLLVAKSAFTGKAQGFINDSVITPDGAALIVVVLHSPRGASTPGTIDVVKVSASTGAKLRVLFEENTGQGVFYRFFSTDPSTRFLILDAGRPTGAIPNGWIDHGRLVPLRPADGSNVFDEAW